MSCALSASKHFVAIKSSRQSSFLCERPDEEVETAPWLSS
jgi:hypothetical protein